ncbi:rootletin-like [Narcine bancroftii]|uniref:rootletin-like n=1 Tax=Narcine bancroftii TaxID=1343680 RepID=UPI00383106D6
MVLHCPNTYKTQTVLEAGRKPEQPEETNMLQQRQESEQEVLKHIEKLHLEKHIYQERVDNLQRVVAQLENEKRELQRSKMYLEKDQSALRKTYNHTKTDKLKSEEDALRLSAEKGQLDQSLSGAEMDLAETQRQIQQLQCKVVVMEWSHSQRLIELTTRHHQQLEKETQRLRNANQQAERILEAKEQAHRQRVTLLQEQLDREMKKRQASIS